MLAITDLTVIYGTGPAAVHALGPISLMMRRGDILAVIGPSGCGKSTLLHALCGILGGHRGSLRLDGTEIDPRRHAIAFVPQDFGLLPWKTVRENCLLPLQVRKGMGGSTPARLYEITGRLGIEGLMDRYPGELSGGQKQRASIARAFSMDPDLLLMDEPFSSLDALTREQAQDLFLDMWNRYGTTAVFVTHSIEEAITVGGRILLLSPRPGKILKSYGNPLFNIENPRQQTEFHMLAGAIRDAANLAWSQTSAGDGGIQPFSASI